MKISLKVRILENTVSLYRIANTFQRNLIFIYTYILPQTFFYLPPIDRLI